MKRLLLLLLALCLCGCSLLPKPEDSTTETSATPQGDPARTVRNYEDFKALWISQFDLASIYLENGSQRPEADYTARITAILANTASLGFNTVILQMRPYADSMYPSAYYPMSRMVVGKYGREATYDPVAIAVEAAHDLDLSVQAWINPMRAMTDTEIEQVNDRYLIKQWYLDPAYKGDYIAMVGNRWYLNPAHAEVRQLVLDGARELLERYPVDGLHMDDYFYPSGLTEDFDRIAYGAYLTSATEAAMPLPDWRRAQLNILVKGLYDTVKSVDPRLIFGISPAGNYHTVYNAQFADIHTWCGSEGYIDYICPQIYFGMEHGSYDFAKVAAAYQDMIQTDSVKLIVGMTLGKAFAAHTGGEDQWAGSGKTEWIDHRDILLRELSHTKTLPTCRGVAYFSYQYFFDPLTGETVAATAEERENFLPLLKTISWS
jgi:uncharacterized lipoprotein YddW (UPF0748 family)